MDIHLDTHEIRRVILEMDSYFQQHPNDNKIQFGSRRVYCNHKTKTITMPYDREYNKLGQVSFGLIVAFIIVFTYCPPGFTTSEQNVLLVFMGITSIDFSNWLVFCIWKRQCRQKCSSSIKVDHFIKKCITSKPSPYYNCLVCSKHGCFIYDIRRFVYNRYSDYSNCFLRMCESCHYFNVHTWIFERIKEQVDIHNAKKIARSVEILKACWKVFPEKALSQVVMAYAYESTIACNLRHPSCYIDRVWPPYQSAFSFEFTS